MYNVKYPTRQQYMNALQLIQSSVEGEKSDAMFYEWLINNIPARTLTPNQAEDIEQVIVMIRDEELGHNKIFKEMYKQLTGKDVVVQEEEFVAPASFTEGIIKALKGELNAVKKYREIIAGLPNNYYRDQVFNVLTDEIRHSSLYNYIYTTTTRA